MSLTRTFFLWNLCFIGCTNGDVDTPTDDTDQIPDTPVPAEQVTNWCDAAAGGTAGVRPFEQDFARAHVGQRLFGPVDSWNEADTQLTFLMASEEPLGLATVPPYASLFEHVCAPIE